MKHTNTYHINEIYAQYCGYMGMAHYKNRSPMRYLLLYIMICLSFDSFAQKSKDTIELIDLKQQYGEYTGGFSVLELKTGKYFQYNPKLCSTRFSPCSTFKIPNSLIGLETGELLDSTFVIKYDSILHPKDSRLLNAYPFCNWFRDLTLKQAFKYSCVWYYQELARRIGEQRMRKYVDLIDYGNNDISSGIDKFWLCGSIMISINEQINFLNKLYHNDLHGFLPRSMQAVKEIMLYESTNDYKLYGKTGGGDCINGKAIGWYVGFVETKTGTYLFAMNIFVNKFDDLRGNFRIDFTKKVLKDLKII
jgi:beta-lactamase class D